MLEAAARLLRAGGYAHLTTNRVADVAGVNVSLVYRYFAGKEALVGALIERAATQTLAALHTALAENVASRLDVAMRAVVVAMMDTPAAPQMHRALVEQIESSGRRRALEDLRLRAQGLFRVFLARRRDVRRLDDGDLFVLAHALEAAVHAAAFYRPRSVSREAVVNALVRLLCATLKKR